MRLIDLLGPLTTTPRAAAFWKQWIGADLRTLALLRVMLAVTCLVEIYTLWPDVFAMFDDRGVFPRRDAFGWQSPFYWSLFYISGRVEWAYLLLGVALLASLSLLVGYRTRIAIVLCWALSLSISTRLVIFTSGAHMLLPMLLFWAMFLPLGARFSVDTALSTRPKEDNTYVSVATLAFLLQMTSLYIFSALLKTHSMWHTTGEAIYYVMNSSEVTSPLGQYLAQWPELMRWLTLYVYYLELVAVFFLFSPVKNARCRLIIFPFLFALHLGFVFFLSIGFFPLVCISGLVIFIPGLFWDRFLPWFNARPVRRGITLYYDEDCGFCRKTCQIFRELGLPPETRILPAQQVPDIYAIMQRENSWVVEDGAGVRRTRWDAVAWCWRRSPLLWPFGVLFIPRFMRPLGDALYHFIASHRGGFGKLTGKLLPEHDKPLAFQPHTLTEIVVAALAVSVLTWNISTLSDDKPQPWRRPLSIVLSTLYLQQKMSFFAPFPYQFTRWVTVGGYLPDGRVVDMLHGHMEPPVRARPEHGYGAYVNHHWYKFYHRANFKRWRWVLGEYYCRDWQERYPSLPADKMVLTVYEQRTPSPGGAVPKEKVLAEISYDCKKSTAK